MFWKRDEEARSGRLKAQREWTTGEPIANAPRTRVANAPGVVAAKDAGAKLTNAPGTAVAKAPEATEVAAPTPTPTPMLRPALGPDTSVTGRLSFTMPTRIDGKLRGEVHATDLLLIGEQGYVEGIVRAPTLVVLGEVRGEVRGAERVEIKAGGRVVGSVETTSLVVQDGGCLDGDCCIAPQRGTVRVLRPAQASNDA